MWVWNRRAPAACGLGYAALAIALTWPLATTPLRHLPLGTEPVVSVPALNAWTVWWNADRLRYAFHDYWNAPIFHPAPYAFAFSEAQPTTLIVAPLVGAGGAALAYNVYLIASLTLNGFIAFRLLRRVGLCGLAAASGGVLMEMLPIVHWQLGVLQLTTIWGVLWVIDRLVALRDGTCVLENAASRTATDDTGVSLDPAEAFLSAPSDHSRFPATRLRVRDAVLLGVSGALCYAACNYFGLFLSVLLPIACAPLVWGRLRNWRFWLLLAVSGAVAAALSAPVLWAQVVAKREYAWTREERLLYDLSARPRDYLNPHRVNPNLKTWLDLPRLEDPERPLWTLGPGPVKISLAGLGLLTGLLFRAQRRWTLFLLLFGGWALLLSFGPSLEIADWATPRFRAASDEPVSGWVPYRLLTRAHPGLALARSPFRFAFFVQIAIALLAAGALDGLWRGTHVVVKRWGRGGPIVRNVAALAIVVTAGGFAAAEVVPTRQRLHEVPDLDQAWIGWLRENSAPTTAIVSFPFPMGATVEDYEATALFMLEQMGHRRPMVDGYSGFFPQSFIDLKTYMSDFPDEVVIQALRDRGVGFVISADEEWTGLAKRTSSLQLAFLDEDAKVSVFRILPPIDSADSEPSP